MKLTPPEKMILVMLADLQEKIGIDGELNPALIKKAIFYDQTWAFDWEFTGIVAGDREPDPPHLIAVVDTLDMWDVLEDAYEKLPPSDQEVAVLAADWGSKQVRFPGWDGNHETEYMASARFLVEDLGRFSRFAGRGMNSHMASVERYAAMYRVFEPLRKQLPTDPLTAEQIGDVLRAWRH